MGIVGLSQKVQDHILLRITGQTKEVLAQQEGIQKTTHHLSELLLEGAVLQHSGEDWCIKPHCIVGRKQHGTAERAEEGDE